MNKTQRTCRLQTALRFSVFAGALLCQAYCHAQTEDYRNPKLSPEVRAHDLVKRMTLEEKALQSINTAPAIPRLGVPAYDYWNEGLHGVARSGYSTLFPQAIGMAATWDAPLLQEIGQVVSTEARAKYNDAIQHGNHSIYFGLTVWSPNINIFRDPRWGRGQETYGEDPFLTGLLGRSFIAGLQGGDHLHPRVIATPKHFAVHSGPESDRHRFNVEPSQHDLWDTYLPQFRSAIVEGHAGSIMCAYNELYGKPACASDLLLKDVLRQDWKFAGFVTSDCGAIDDFFEKNAHRYSPDKASAAAAGVLAGTDTNCGSTYKALPESVRRGLLKESDLDRTLERLFVARIRLGLFDPAGTGSYDSIPFSANRSPAHLATSLKAARESMVLLKNDGILPLQEKRYKTIAVIGPNATSLSALEGNYNAIAKDPQKPLDGLRSALPKAHVLFAEGAPYAEGVPVPVPRTMLHPSVSSRQEGLKAEYFAASSANLGAAFSAKPVVTRVDREIDFDWNSAAPVAGVSQEAFAVRWSGVIVPIKTGAYDFNMRLAHCYPCGDREYFSVKIDGNEVTHFGTNGGPSRESSTPPFQVSFSDTKPHAIVVEYTHQAPLFGGGITMEWVPPADALREQAVATATQSDLVVAMVGLSPELEGEEMKIRVEGFAGGDRTDVALPANQVKLLEAVAATGKPIVVIALNGSALALNWAQEHANATLEAWYPGEFGGRAIAETLTGANNPGGRLPITFYRSVEDLPSFDDYSMKNRTYRYFKGQPLYGFGYGLSYTSFSYSGLKLSTNTLRAGEPLEVGVDVKNTGQRMGDEVAELYLTAPASGNGGLSPELQLEGVQRVRLKQGESRHLVFKLTPRELSEVNSDGVRSVQAGEYSLFIGSSQPAKGSSSGGQAAKFSIDGSFELPR